MADETQPKITRDDVPLWGANAIAAEIGLDRGQTYHLLNRGLLPARQIGRRWVSTPSQLRKALGSESE
jgi:hypothetical protein